jgi:hypothetical protein
MSIEEVQHLLLEQDIPIEIAKELAVIILRDLNFNTSSFS